MAHTDTPVPTAAPPARGSRLLRIALWLVAVLLLLLALAIAAAWFVLRTERGSAWALAQVPGLEVSAPRGRLWGDFAAERLVYRPDPEAAPLLVVDDASWRGLRLTRTIAGRWRVVVDELQAARVRHDPPPAPPSDEPMRPPDSLELPLELQVHALRIGEFDTPALGGTPLRELRAELQLGANHGGLHRLDGLSLVWGRLQADGRLHIGTRAPFALQAAAHVSQDAAASPVGVPWEASATLVGPLSEAALLATLHAQPNNGRPAQTLDAAGTVTPFAPWPLPRLRARTAGLDLSTLLPQAPATALSGEAVIDGPGGGQPFAARIALGNGAPGRWSDGRLPVQSLEAEVELQPASELHITLRRAALELGNTERPAGRLQASGHWTPAQWQAQLALDGLRPAELDARAPAVRLSGPLTLAGSGFDSAGLEQALIDAQATLSGQWLDARGRPLGDGEARATLDAVAGLHRLELRSATLAAGPARATLAGTAERSAPDAPWRAQGRATLADFDPLAWWPGADGSPLRQGEHRLNAEARFDLTLPTAASGDALAQLAALRGEAALTLADSLLAGVPLSGELSLRSASAARTDAAAQLDLAGNQLQAEAQIVTTGGGARDHWTVALDAPALPRLTPLYRLFAGHGELSGALRLQAEVDGRWPAIATRGRLEGDSLVAGPARVGQARAQWQVAASADAPLEVQASLSQLVWDAAADDAQAGRTLDSLRLSVDGTLAAHRAELQGEARALPPAWTEVVQPPPAAAQAAPRHTVVRLEAEGGVLDPPAAAGSPGPWHIAGWRGRVQRLEVGPSAAGAPPWLRTGDLGLEWIAGAAPQLSLTPGRAELLGAALRWSRLHWQGASGTQPARLDAEAELEPLQLAPILARLQPDFGWGGDLAIAGHVDVRTAAGLEAEVVIERRSGDLSVTDETGTRALGLTDLRLALDARDGVWSFTQALAGEALGVAAGAVVARTAPDATWPGADTPIDGVLEIRVADLGTWGTWVPAGWRLAGSLHTSAAIGGRFGAPEYTGSMRGSGLGVRNFLEGVNVHDGELAVSLRGRTARVEHFTARAGDGSVSLEGSALLGEQPSAELRLVADRFQVLGRVDRRIVASGQARLQLDADALALDGRFRVDQGLIDFTRSDAPSLSDDVIVVRGGREVTAEPEDADAGRAAPQRDLRIDLHVDLGDALRLRGRGIDTRLAGELRITAPGGELALFGTVRTVEGTYDAYGQALAIDRGLLTFNGPVANPRLDIEATRRNTDIRVGVAVSGTAQDPRVRLFSEPEMSEMDKLSWLVLGRASSGLGGADTALLQRAALALLAGEGKGTGDKLTQAIGLDELSVGQTEDGGVQDTVVRLGKQLSRRWYVGYERGLNATTGTWELIYRIAQRFTLRAQSGLDNALDVIWTWRWG